MAGKIAAGRQICAPELSVRESGSTLPEDAAMHTLPENGVLRIHFCASGAKIRKNAAKEHLHLEVPAETNLSILTMSAPVQAAALDPRILLIAAFSGGVRIDALTAETARIAASSGSVHLTLTDAPSTEIQTSSGKLRTKRA